MRTKKQIERQRFREAGKYAKVNPCQLCGKSAGVDYCSDRRTDSVDSCGNRWADIALALCAGRRNSKAYQARYDEIRLKLDKEPEPCTKKNQPTR